MARNNDHFYYLSKLILLIIATAIISSCSQSKMKAEPNNTSDTFYTCTMDPQVHEDHPGDCPICGMPMVPAIDSVKEKQTDAPADTSLPLEKRNIISSLATIHAEQKTIQQKISAEGVIAYDTREEKNIASRYSGRIEKLYVKYMYQPIKKGDLLFEIYSAEMVTAQQELIFLLSNDKDNTNLIDASKKKLLLLGMSQEQIASVVKTKQIFYKLPVYSPEEGHIHQTLDGSQMSNSNSDELSMKEGMYVTKGQTIFNLLDPHEVLASIKIAEGDAAQVKLHQPVMIMIEGSNKMENGIIDFVEPFFQSNSKTISARVYLMNEAHDLKVGMFVNATIVAASVSGLWIPKTAMIDLGKEKIVWLKNKTTFEAHTIKTGIQSGDLIQVIEGINDSEEIASNAQYIADSESLIGK